MARVRTEEQKEQKRVYMREYVRRHRVEKQAYNAQYLEDHREENKEHSTKYYYEHKEAALRKRKEYRETNAEEVKRSKRWSYLKKTYGLTTQAWDELYTQQGGGCAICGRSLTDVKVCVDHNHETGEVRGLLCVSCNTAIGSLREDPNLLRRAIVYLAR